MKFSEGYKLKLNVAAIKIFEKLSGKSFYKVGDDDVKLLIYSCIKANNEDFNLTESAFDNLFKNQRFVSWIEKERENIVQEITMFKKDPDNEGEAGKESEPPKLTDLSNDLILSFHMDAHFVNYEMPIYEMEDYCAAAERAFKSELAEKRLFSYLECLPHFTKKISLEKFLPFPWEEEAKKKEGKRNLEINKANILATFKKMNDNGEGANDTNSGREDIQDIPELPEKNGECGKDCDCEEGTCGRNEGDSGSGKI